MRKLIFISCFVSFISSTSFLSASSSWNSDPYDWVRISPSQNGINSYKAVSDGERGAFVVWMEGSGTNSVIYAQKMDQSGNLLWGEEGVTVVSLSANKQLGNILPDGNGGLHVVWADDWYEGSYNYDIYYTRITKEGDNLYPAGSTVCDRTGKQENAKMVSDMNSGVIIAWEDEWNGWFETDIFAQRIDSSGNILWVEGGIPICTADDRQENPFIVSDNNNGAIIVWEDERHSGSYDFYAQRINSNGETQWDEDGILIHSSDYFFLSIDEVIPTGDGGAYIAWTEAPSGGSFQDENIYVQKIGPSGNITFGDGGVEIFNMSGWKSNIQLLSDNNSGVIATWMFNSKKIFLQQLSPDGIEVLGENGVEVIDLESEGVNIDNYYTLLDSSGIAFIALSNWMEDGTEYTGIYGLKFDYNGNQKWNIDGLPIAIGEETKENLYVVSDGNGGGIVFFTCWLSQTIGNTTTNWTSLFTQNVDTNGRLGAFDKWYIAEGCTNGFDEWVLIMNPNNYSVPVKVTFMKPDGSTHVEYITVDATSRYTIHVNDYVPNESVSTMVESLDRSPIMVERAMYWNSGDLTWAGGHCASGLTSLSNTWYLAEGCTDGFDEWILIMNPNTQSTDVWVTFMKPDGSTVEEEITVGPTSRYTIHANDYVPNISVSTEIYSTLPIAVERAMYWDSNGYKWIGGHVSTGVTQPAREWHLAEGATLGSFDEWVLLMNPNENPANVQVTFMKPDGSTVEDLITVGATSRYTIHVNDYVPNESVSTRVQSNSPIIAERAMYWDSDSINWIDGHVSQGTNTPALRWDLPEGYTGGSFDEWVLIMNPYDTDAQVKITFMKPDGSTLENTITVKATSRYTIHVDDYISNDSVSTKIESLNNIPVIAERAMYWDSAGKHWAGGHDSIGIK